MQLADLIDNLPGAHVDGPTDIPTTNVAYDSRKIEKSGVFVAIKGTHVDGHRFIGQAIARGAVAVVYDDPAARTAFSDTSQRTTWICVANSRAALSPIAAAFFRYPARELAVVGVTGSKGKTTTSTLLAHVLDAEGPASGLMTTVDFKIGARWWANKTRQTTLEALDVQRMLRDMANAGCRFAVVEASSHALSPQWNRVGDCQFDVAVFTNITHEHLDYHGSFEQYRHDKARLFDLLQHNGKQRKIAIVNVDDPNAQFFIDAAGSSEIITYGMRNDNASVRPRNVHTTRDGVRYTAITPWGEVDVQLAIPGAFNVLNSLSALAVGASQGIDLGACAAALQRIDGVRGRMERIELGQPFTVVVDYAHNPDSFEQVMGMMRPLTTGKLISVFGSAGERDHEKRALQGALAGRYCDLVVITDEDPRDEEPEHILEAIAGGVRQAGKTEGRSYLKIADRANAIREAVRRAAPGDIVLLLGKGHESNILYENGRSIPWSERDEATMALRELGFEG